MPTQDMGAQGMTARKRKQPEKKKRKASRGPGLAMRGLSLVGRLASRHPAAVGGSAAFIVVFSFVAGNAMWYQPGEHPSPFLRTRLPMTHPGADLAAGLGRIEPKKVTTFVIQREGETQTASIDRPVREQVRDAVAEQPLERPAPQAAAAESPARLPEGEDLVAAVQQALSRRGLYDGPADGKAGPKTTAAIRQFESRTGRRETGLASPALLALLQAQNTGTRPAARPVERPYETAAAGKGELDPVAAAIRNAEIDPQFIPKVDIPASSELVMKIQKGLSNLAYADVSVDGVAGEQTRLAIRHFEKHYRLPETGQPSDKVLNKMREIGAL